MVLMRRRSWSLILKWGRKPAWYIGKRLCWSRWEWSRLTRIFSKVLLRAEVSCMGRYEDKLWSGLSGLGNIRVFEVFHGSGKKPVRRMNVYIVANSVRRVMGASLRWRYVIVSMPGAVVRLCAIVSITSSRVIGAVSGWSGSWWLVSGWRCGESIFNLSAGCLRNGLKGGDGVKISCK